jgi:CheY-like chemotaxis protein
MILVIDDEAREMDSYVQELRLCGFEVSFFREVDAALEFFGEHMRDIDLLILDIMMPPGNAFKDENTLRGLRTGLFFFERVRSSVPEVPTIILTNVSDPHIAARFEHAANCLYLRKEDYLPFELAEEVRYVLQQDQTKDSGD